MNKSLPSRPQGSSVWFEHLRRLSALAVARGAEDSELAYDLMSLRAGFGLPERSQASADLLWCLAWHLGVRAPVLDIKWVVSASLVLDKVHWGKLSLLQVIEQLEALERGYEQVDAWLRSEQPDPPLRPLARLAASPERLRGLQGAALEEAVRQDLGEALRFIEDAGLFEQALEQFPMRRS